MKGYAVHGSREMIDVGIEALEALRTFLRENSDESTEVAEIRIYENMPVEVVVCDDMGAETMVWCRDGWVDR